MYKPIVETYLLQCKRFISIVFKKYGFYTVLGLISVAALLVSMSLILQNMLMEMLELILLEGDHLMHIQLYRTLIFAVHCCSVIVYFISLLLGANQKSQFEKMLQNYGVGAEMRNMLSSLARCIMIISVSTLLSFGLLGMSFMLIEAKLYLIMGLLCQVLVSVFLLETSSSLIRFLLSAFNETALMLITAALTGYLSYLAYKNGEHWQITSFIIEPTMIGYGILIISILAYIWVMSFDFRNRKEALVQLRGRMLPSNLCGKTMKEMLRHKEAALNTNLMFIICFGITMIKPELFYDPAMCSVMLIMPSMQAIYTYSCLEYIKHVLHKQSIVKVYLAHFMACTLVVLGHTFVLLLINRDLIDGLSPILILSSVFFLFIGKIFPLNPKNSFNSTLVIVLIMLALLPAMLLGMEINKILEFSKIELILLQIIAIILLKGGTYHSLNRTLR